MKPTEEQIQAAWDAVCKASKAEERALLAVLRAQNRARRATEVRERACNRVLELGRYVQQPHLDPGWDAEPKGRRICAWCKADMGPAQTELNTHGICDKCQEKFK